MTTYDAPPPPPPPPALPPSQDSASGFDFAKPFTFVFEDPDWVKKVLFGGLFAFLGMFLVGPIFLLGYLARLVRNVAASMNHPLPEWDDLSEYFSEGLRLFGVALVYYLPLILLVCFMVIPAILVGNMRNGEEIAGVIFSGVFCLMFPVIFLLAIIVPIALMRVVFTGRFAAGFEIGEIFRFIKANIVTYLLTVAVYIVSQCLAQFGVVLCCIGVFVTSFWSMVATAHAVGQTWRLARN